MKQFINFLRGILSRGRKFFSPRTYEPLVVSDFPQQAKVGVVYIVKDGVEPSTLIFKCPCGCNSNIYLNMLTDTRPRWKFRINLFGIITIYPSIWRRVGCKSHFYIKKGRVISC